MTANARRLLSKVVGDRNPSLLREAGLDENYFPDPLDRQVWDAINDGVTRFGQIPSLATLRMDFPEYKFIAVEDDWSYLLERLQRDHMSSLLSLTINVAAEAYDNEDFEGAKDAIEQGITALTRTKATGLRTLDLLGLAEKWENDRAKKEKGCPFGIDEIDEETGGIYADQLCTFVGPPGAGKSAHLLNSAMATAAIGRRALLITIEMADEHQMARVVANKTGIPYKEIRRGDPSDDQLDQIADALETIHDEGNLIIQEIPADMATLATVREQIEKYAPDITYIDGAYLMQLPGVRNNAAQWEQLSALTREMKATILRTHRPIVLSTQVLESKMNGKEVTTKSVGYSASFLQDSDIMIGIQPDGEDPDRQVVRLLKFRDGRKIDVHVAWEWEIYRMHSVAPEPQPDAETLGW